MNSNLQWVELYIKGIFNKNKILTFNWSVILSSWFVKNGFPLMAKELCVVRYAYLLKGKELFCECFLKEKKTHYVITNF